MRRIAFLLLGAVAFVFVAVTGWYIAGTRVETPAYAVETADGAVEIRRYPSLIAAVVTRPGARQTAARAAFSPLARYIFGRDRGGDAKIAMTAPVTQTADTGPASAAPADGASQTVAWRVRFLMPAGATLATLPPPAGDVRLDALPPARVAAIRFSGRWTDSNFARAERALSAWLAARGLTAAGPPTYAYYNDPFTPPFLRRNEILLPLPN